jgi:molybdate transport system regulatory protein
MKKPARAFIKIDLGEGVRFGPGKLRLLEMVLETGSISAAARRMDMSYRRAWLLIEEMNSMFATPLVATSAGGAGGGGAEVTPLGLKMIAQFHQLQKSADELVRQSLRGLKL